MADGVPDGSVALIFQIQCLLSEVFGSLRFEVDINACLVAHFSAQKLIDGGVVIFALQIPQSNVDAGNRRHDHGAAEMHTAGQAIVDIFDVQRVEADEVVLHCVDTLGGCFLIAPCTAFAVAHKSGVGMNFDEKIALSCQNCFDICDFHRVAPIRMPGTRS